MQVDLGSLYQVTAVAIQGRQDLSQWVTSYKVAYSLDGLTFDTVTANGVDVVSSITNRYISTNLMFHSPWLWYN